MILCWFLLSRSLLIWCLILYGGWRRIGSHHAEFVVMPHVEQPFLLLKWSTNWSLPLSLFGQYPCPRIDIASISLHSRDLEAPKPSMKNAMKYVPSYSPRRKGKQILAVSFLCLGAKDLSTYYRWLYSVAPSSVADHAVVFCSLFTLDRRDFSSCSHLSSKYFMRCQRESKFYRQVWFVDCCAKTKRNGGQRGEKTNVGSE